MLVRRPAIRSCPPTTRSIIARRLPERLVNRASGSAGSDASRANVPGRMLQVPGQAGVRWIGRWVGPRRELWLDQIVSPVAEIREM